MAGVHSKEVRSFNMSSIKRMVTNNDGTIIKEDGVAVVEDAEILNSLLVHQGILIAQKSYLPLKT
jgi:hypothetical protein